MFRLDSRRLRRRLRTLLLVTSLLGSLTVVSQAISEGGSAEWSTIGRDAANSRNQPFEHAINVSSARTLEPKWVATTTGDVSGTPAVVGGAVYFGDFGGTLWKLDAETGGVYPGLAGLTANSGTGLGCGGVWSSPAVDVVNNLVVFGTASCSNAEDENPTSSSGRHVASSQCASRRRRLSGRVRVRRFARQATASCRSASDR